MSGKSSNKGEERGRKGERTIMRGREVNGKECMCVRETHERNRPRSCVQRFYRMIADTRALNVERTRTSAVLRLRTEEITRRFEIERCEKVSLTDGLVGFL